MSKASPQGPVLEDRSSVLKHQSQLGFLSHWTRHTILFTKTGENREGP